ncbi:erythromycin esterase family protein [Novosphingobium sp. Gsoil 351]|uniref:erythromycin esterase family protein n=1 Tax=Novosphingobium sp. Gsoil 351 TaxID=2675225 RepID=UPI0012B4D005|nr:erythromycin esterase family protein [Novosphingobium sp. Gsoil 351]QGN55484.1 hypothetical protein GKE62_13915 [Novosphingobium sp. Gsoil 351]
MRKNIWMGVIVACLVCASAQAQVVEPNAPPSLPPPQAIVEWLAANAAPIDVKQHLPAGPEAAAIDSITSGARVIGLGESNHGNREPLAYRNRLIRYLVERRELTAVALESGFAESRQLYDYVLGGPGDPAALLDTGLTHGFGNLRENLELITWLRAWNAQHSGRPVRLYGIDRSTIQSAPPGVRRRSVVLDHVARYLERTIPRASAPARIELMRFADRFTENDYQGYAAEDRTLLDRTLATIQAMFVTHRSEMIRRSGADDFAWAQREAYDAARLPELFRIWNVDGSDLGKLIQVIEVRDQAMADHVLWALRREGPRGRVLLFQANGHVTKAPMIGSVMRNFARQPILTGIALRRALGGKYRTIATVSSRGREASDDASGSLDRAFAAARRSPSLLSLRQGRPSGWWRKVQSASQGDTRLDDFAPARAFDGLLYFDRLTPVTPLRPRTTP